MVCNQFHNFKSNCNDSKIYRSWKILEICIGSMYLSLLWHGPEKCVRKRIVSHQFRMIGVNNSPRWTTVAAEGCVGTNFTSQLDFGFENTVTFFYLLNFKILVKFFLLFLIFLQIEGVNENIKPGNTAKIRNIWQKFRKTISEHYLNYH